MSRSSVYRRAHIYSYGQIRVASEPNLHVCGLWDEAGVMAGSHGGSIQTPHRQMPVHHADMRVASISSFNSCCYFQQNMFTSMHVGYIVYVWNVCVYNLESPFFPLFFFGRGGGGYLLFVKVSSSP